MINFELIINISIIILLLLNIIYVWRLNRNLSVLRQNHDSMFSLAQSLNDASGKAENAVRSLKSAAAETAESLQNIVEDAKNVKEELQTLAYNHRGKSTYTPDSDFRINQNDSPQFKSEAELELIKALRSIK